MKRQRVLDYLRTHPDKTSVEVAVAIGVWSITAWVILARLEDLGLVEARFLGVTYPRRRVYRLKGD